MKPDQYIELAGKTESFRLKTLTAQEFRLLHAALGLVTESGEVADLIKKYIYYEKEYTYENLLKEVGDVLWYVAIILRVTGVSFEKVMKDNIDKLRTRYPDGVFNSDAAINRVHENIN